MIKAFKYGMLEPVAGFDQAAIDVLFLRNKLWNSLVELERAHRERYRSLITGSDEELSAIQARLDQIEAERAELVRRKKQARAMVRSKKVDTSEHDDRIDRLMAERSDLRAKAKDIRLRVKEKVKPAISDLEKERYEAVKRLIHEAGLWWCNQETVIAAYDVARVKAMKENAELRFRSFDGTGKFAVRQSGGFALSDLVAGKLSFARLEALPDANFVHLSERGKRSRARHHLTMTILTYKDESGKLRRHEVTWPIVLHRPLPEGTIKFIHVQRKRIGKEFQWTCSITMEVDEIQKTPIDHPSRAACGIDIGYRLVNDGLRVAVIADTSGEIDRLTLPKDWIEKMDHVESIQGQLDNESNLTWGKLKAFLKSLHDYPESLAESIGQLLKAGDRTPVRGMRALHWRLRSEPETMPEVLSILDEWEAATFRREREMHRLRHKLVNRRKDLYRNFAHKVANRYVMIRIEDMPLKKLAAVNLENGSDNPMPQTVRNNRTRAALHELTLCLRQAADKSGADFEKVSGTNSTVTCSTCGHQNPGVDKEDIHFRCEKCDTLHDQDENAAKNFLRGREFYRAELMVA
jgi:hypothetical protein